MAIPAIGSRVHYTGREKGYAELPRPGQFGTLTSQTAERAIRGCAETPEERVRLDAEYRAKHAMVRWDGCVHAWNTSHEDYEFGATW